MMSDAPKISIVMPVYNVEKYLREIDSCTVLSIVLEAAER